MMLCNIVCCSLSFSISVALVRSIFDFEFKYESDLCFGGFFELSWWEKFANNLINELSIEDYLEEYYQLLIYLALLSLCLVGSSTAS